MLTDAKNFGIIVYKLNSQRRLDHANDNHGQEITDISQ